MAETSSSHMSGNGSNQGPNKNEKAIVKSKLPQKKPQLSKAERRALQEKQRAEKAAKTSAGGKKVVKGGQNSAKRGTASVKRDVNVANEENKAENIGCAKMYKEADKTLQLFSHLPQYRDRSRDPHLSGVTLHSSDKNLKVELHPAVLALGVKYSNGSIRGANARCRAMMDAFKAAIRDYIPPIATVVEGSDGSSSRINSSHSLQLPTLLDQQVIKPSFQHWTTQCRVHSVTMGNAVSFLKIAIANLSRDEALQSAQEIICEQIDAYVQERINFADQVITKHGLSKIGDQDVILVYGRSEVIQQLLLTAADLKKNFRVIVADSRPLLEGRETLKAFVAKGIPCTYILLNSLSYVIMREVTKVFLGVAALMSDGSVLSRVGTASVALIAKSNNIPVLFCCESYKISNRVQLESFTGNELGDPQDLMKIGSSFDEKNDRWLDNFSEKSNLKLLNLVYDLTPSEFVSGIVTELGILPPTSVAVLLREMNQSNAAI